MSIFGKNYAGSFLPFLAKMGPTIILFTFYIGRQCPYYSRNLFLERFLQSGAGFRI